MHTGFPASGVWLAKAGELTPGDGPEVLLGLVEEVEATGMAGSGGDGA